MQVRIRFTGFNKFTCLNLHYEEFAHFIRQPAFSSSSTCNFATFLIHSLASNNQDPI
jgi:hypothetical protein